MTTYNASKMAAGIQPKVLMTGAGVAVLSTFVMLAAAKLVTNDLVNMLQIGADASEQNPGPYIMGVVLDADQMDTGAGVVLAVGDATTANRFITGATTGQAGGIQGANVAGSYGYQPFATTFNTYTTPSLATYMVVLKATTGVTTATASSTVRLKVEYSYDP